MSSQKDDDLASYLCLPELNESFPSLLSRMLLASLLVYPVFYPMQVLSSVGSLKKKEKDRRKE
jgi:hypothetical protein